MASLVVYFPARLSSAAAEHHSPQPFVLNGTLCSLAAYRVRSLSPQRSVQAEIALPCTPFRLPSLRHHNPKQLSSAQWDCMTRVRIQNLQLFVFNGTGR